MLIDKYAPWGKLPAPQRAGAPDPNSLRSDLQDIAKSLLTNANLGRSIDRLTIAMLGVKSSVDGVASAVTRQFQSISNRAFALEARMSQLRDVFCDMHAPDLESANRRLEQERDALLHDRTFREMPHDYPDLWPRVRACFRELQGDDLPGERKVRLLELVGVECEVIAVVQDLAAPPQSPRNKRA
jgi:hypothetical protein